MDGSIRFPILGMYTPWKYNIAPEKLPSQKESSLPTISGGYVKFQGSNSWFRGLQVFFWIIIPVWKLTHNKGDIERWSWSNYEALALNVTVVTTGIYIFANTVIAYLLNIPSIPLSQCFGRNSTCIGLHVYLGFVKGDVLGIRSHGIHHHHSPPFGSEYVWITFSIRIVAMQIQVDNPLYPTRPFELIVEFSLMIH